MRISQHTYDLCDSDRGHVLHEQNKRLQSGFCCEERELHILNFDRTELMPTIVELKNSCNEDRRKEVKKKEEEENVLHIT